ncbi:unnamed protein product [Dicrocoelium dendriticum]|nr:unnamed protein product [Dicrocoelium dendriticum]
MGSGFQRHKLSDNRIDDDTWHTVELARYDVRSNVIISTVDKGELTELKTHLPVIRGKLSRNFNLADKLYIGGAHEDIFYRWRERINYRFGFQGCLANLSVNDQLATDPLACLNKTSFRNTTMGDVTAGCFTLPTYTKRCNNRLAIDSLYTDDEPTIFKHTLPMRDKTCHNGGTCVQLWTSLRCICELTAFKGHLCDLPGTVLQMVSSDMPHAKNGSLIKYDPVWRTNSYVLLTYTDDARHTLKDEFVFGIQLDWINSILEIPSEDNLEMICTLLYVTNEKHAGDFLHVYMVSVT